MASAAPPAQRSDPNPVLRTRKSWFNMTAQRPISEESIER
jgi:hypothetical protein